MSKWTPGPWLITEQDPPEIHGNDERRTVVCITTAPRSNEWNMADARLIAAAPELAEALADCVEALGHLQDSLAVRVNPPTLEAARALLARINGDEK